MIFVSLVNKENGYTGLVWYTNGWGSLQILCLHGVLPRPFFGQLLVLGLVSLVQPGDLRHERVVWVWVAQ